MITPEIQEHKEYTFEAFCKTLLKNKARDLHTALNQQAAAEITYDEIPIEVESTMLYEDSYSVLPPIRLSLKTKKFTVSDPNLAQAIMQLLPKYRDILFLAYFIGLDDREIGAYLRISDRTVTSRRKNALRRLKERMLKNI